jgi:hypothetical protein
MAAAVVLALGLVGAGAAGAQTSSSTSSSTSTSTSTTTTSLVPFVHPCLLQPCAAQPPQAFLSGSGGEVRLDQGSSCWTSPPDAEGRSGTLCADAAVRVPDAVLAVRVGETLTLRFSALVPTVVVVQEGDVGRGLTPGNPVTFVADLAPGVHAISVFTRWAQGDAGYSVRLDVRATASPAPQTSANIALTG